MAKGDNNELDPNIKAIIEAQQAQMDRMQTMVETILLSQGGSDNPALLEKMTAILDKMTGDQAKTAEILERARKQEVRPSNNVAHMRSVFNRRGETLDGYTKPRLLCEMMIPWRAEDESLTREEVELLNLLTNAPGLYVIMRNDDTKVKISVRMEYNEDETRVTKMVFQHETAFKNEYFRTMPPLRLMLRQMLSQTKEDTRKKAEEVMTDTEEALLIETGKLAVAV